MSDSVNNNNPETGAINTENVERDRVLHEIGMLPHASNTYMQEVASDYSYPNPEPDGKHWYESKTIWFNALFIILSIVTAATPTLEQHLTPEVYAVLASGVAFINALLRLITGQPINKGTG